MRVFFVASFFLFFSSPLFSSPVQLVHDSEDHIIVEVAPGKVQQQDTYAGPNLFTRFYLEGFQPHGDLGGPALLETSRYLSIPAGKKPVVKILSRKTQTLSLKNLPMYYEG